MALIAFWKQSRTHIGGNLSHFHLH